MITVLEDAIEKAVEEITNNHHKIIDDWCKVYMAQRYNEGKSIDVGSFTLCQQNLSWAQNEVGFKYWFEDGKPDLFPKRHRQWVEWVSIAEEDKRPINHASYLVTDGIVVTVGYYDTDEFVGCESDIIKTITHWMEFPKVPEEKNGMD